MSTYIVEFISIIFSKIAAMFPAARFMRAEGGKAGLSTNFPVTDHRETRSELLMIGSIYLRITAILLIIIAFFITLAYRIDPNQTTALHLGAIVLLSGAAVGLISLLLYLWIGRPLSMITRSMNSENAELAKKVLQKPSEFNHIAALVLRSFDQKKDLMAEIADRKQAQEALLSSEERYRNLVETSPDAIVLLDINGKILFGNQRSLAVFGFATAQELQSKSILDLVPPPEANRTRRILDSARKRERIRDNECVMQRKDLSAFPAEMSISLLRNSAGLPDGFIGILRDITSRKAAEREKVRLDEQFRAVYKMEAVGQLAGGVAHDFNNILGAISGYADMIRQRYAGDARLEKYSGMILSAATRAADLTNKLLTFARKGKLQIVTFNLNELIREAVGLLEHSLGKNIRIVQQLAAQDLVMNGDAGQIQGAIMNLAFNARDAMPLGGILTLKTESIELDDDFVKSHAYMVTTGPYLLISVSDTGSGMDKQVMARLFEPFFTTKEIGKGTGLGLASAYGTVKSHNGYIDVSSKPGEGSTFTIYFPAVPGLSCKPGEETQSTIKKGKGHILVVDDEGFLRDALREMLSWLGYTVSTCSDGNEALAFFKNSKINVDLVIMDMVMPGIDGRECYRQLRNINESAKVLLATGFSIEEERQNILSEGIVGIIQKPFISAQLAQAVHNAISS